MTRIVYFGSSAFSTRVLDALLEKLDPAEFSVNTVVSQDGKPVGRDHTIQDTPVAQLAERVGIAVLKPSKLKDPAFIAAVREAEPDLFIVAAYGKIIPAEVLAIPKRGSLNVHGSLLPAYRGASPIHRALLDGAKETGITIMLMDELMDHGPVLLERSINIGRDEIFPELETRLAEVARQLLLEAVPRYLDGTLQPKVQDHAAATFSKIIGKQDGEIHWEDPASTTFNKYRAYFTWPGIWTKLDGKILKLTKISLGHRSAAPKHQPGEVFQGTDDSRCFVQCGTGYIELLEVHLEGGRAMPVQDFLKGHPKFWGTILGK